MVRVNFCNPFPSSEKFFGSFPPDLFARTYNSGLRTHTQSFCYVPGVDINVNKRLMLDLFVCR